MILGQRLKNAALQLGNKAISSVNTIGDKMKPIINTVQKAKQIYSYLEKIIPRRRLAL